MRNFLFGACFALLIVFVYQYCDYRRQGSQEQLQSSALLQQQLENVGKLIVTESNFTQIHNYEDSKKYYFDALTFKKKALVVVDAKAQVSYDLRQMEVRIDTSSKTVVITHIPEPELSLSPKIEYFDVEGGFLNDFDAESLNAISAKVTDSLRMQALQSPLMSNAQNRLISELQQLFVLTNSMGWSLIYRDRTIKEPEDWVFLD
ncbi:DUF4230 domain-containing protein [Gilvibacter sediminis]|uniref:DUF4230 domain-containing protein n=1 Tax=Gilvibacter sediminis TaxID=379071 RepID=UPI0023502447|nr:DUF4230 domain-containing protein [Gilvibacter sediminis]MDC7997495.1 DUF4230 domain-containing protein [Gilvibacter sediminis]